MLRRAKLGLAALLSGLTVAVLAGAVVGGEDAVAPTAPGQPTQTAPRPDGKPVVLAFGGDVHFEGVLESKLAADPSGMLDPIEPVFRHADLAVVNLETAVTTGGSPTVKAFTFRTPATAFAALRGAGVDLASMANNHGLDYGVEGLRDSLAAAKRYRFPVVGIGLNDEQAYRPFRATVKGQRIAVIGATQVLDDELISAWTAGPGKPGLASAKDVPRLVPGGPRCAHDVRHRGRVPPLGHRARAVPVRRSTATREGRSSPPGPTSSSVAHAHRLQGAGRLGKALVGYGLGNFVWYGTSELSTQTGVLLVTVDGRRVLSYRWVPARIVDGVPRPLAGVGASQRDLLVALAPRLHRPEAVGPGLHFPAAGR